MKKIKSDTFSLDLYRKVLLKAKACGYHFSRVCDFKENLAKFPKLLLLRHDIDVSPVNALAMAELEHKLGAISSYYVLLNSNFYNPAAEPFWDALKKIVSLGFELGLHYDTSFFEKRKSDPLAGILRNVSALESILEIKIRSVSQHKPASSSLIKQINEYYLDAYNDELINGFCYISDSGFKWRNKTLIDLIGECDKIHALIHPTTWFYAELDMAQTYRKSASNIGEMIKQQFEDFINSTNQYLLRRDTLDQQRSSKYQS